MTEAQDSPTDSAQQGSQAQQPQQEQEGRAPDAAPSISPGEQMARKLVRDVAAFEVDPPPPARADPTPQQGPGSAAAE